MACSVIRDDDGIIRRVLAENGKDSKLFTSINEIIKDKEEALKAWAQVYTPTFKTWFGRSKIVDDNGEPLLMLHASDSQHTVFERKKIDKINTGAAKGFHFTSSKFDLKRYGKNVYPVFLRVEQPRWGFNPSQMFTSVITKDMDGWVSRFDIDEVRSAADVVVYESNQIKSLFNDGQFSLENEAIYHQLSGTESSKASSDTVRKVQNFLTRVGVDVQTVRDIKVNNQRIGSNGMTNAAENLIQIVEGKESVALTEEGAHVAVEILQQKNPKLFEQMFNQIGGYQIFQTTMSEYRDIYRTSDGKPDVRKIKKEAMGKLLAEMIIGMNEGVTEKPELMAKAQTWWSQIVEFLKGLFNKAPNPFRQAAADLLEGRIDGSLIGDDIFYQVADDATGRMFNNLVNVHQRMAKNANGKYEIDGKEVRSRVSDKVKQFYEKLFPSDKKKADKEAAFDQMASQGTAIHADLEDIFGRHIDRSTGLRRDAALPRQGVSQTHPTNDSFYQTLEDYFVKLLDAKDAKGNPLYPEGTRFLSEVQIFDARKDEGGTIDFLAIIPQETGEPKVDIRDWKSMAIGRDKDDVPWYKKEAFNIQLGEYKEHPG